MEGKLDKQEEVKKQKPFLIDMTLPTSEMLGKFILSELETTQAWVVPIYDGKPTEQEICQLFSPPATMESRSVQRRIAAQKGLPAPDFSDEAKSLLDDLDGG